MGAGMLDTVRELLTGDADPMVVSNCMSVIQKVAPLLSQCMRARPHASWASSGRFLSAFSIYRYIEDCRGRPLRTFGYLILFDIKAYYTLLVRDSYRKYQTISQIN